MTDSHIAFQGEVQLLNWSETHNGGAKIVLQLADAADLEKFKSMTVKKGNHAGQRLATVMVEIGDDEKPVEQAPFTPEPKQRPGELCIMACTFCADPKFWEWASMSQYECRTEAHAKEWVLGVCSVQSRKEIDTNKIAETRFHTLIREPFLAWRNKGK